MDCEGLNFDNGILDELVVLTGPSGPHKLGYTFSDIRTRVLPEALAQAYPSRKIERADLITAVARVPPSPSMFQPEKDLMELHGRRIHITGSAAPDADEAKLDYAHGLSPNLQTPGS